MSAVDRRDGRHRRVVATAIVPATVVIGAGAQAERQRLQHQYDEEPTGGDAHQNEPLHQVELRTGVLKRHSVVHPIGAGVVQVEIADKRQRHQVAGKREKRDEDDKAVQA